MVHWLAVAALIFAFTYEKEADAASVSVLHGDGYANGDNTRNALRFDVTKVGSYGMFYGRADAISYDDVNAYTATRLVIHGGSGLHLAYNGQAQKGVSANSFGVGYTHFAKWGYIGADVYQLSSNTYGDSKHYFLFGSYTPSTRIKVEGFVEFIQSHQVLFSQPSLLLKAVDGVWVGIEYQLYQNKNGIKGLDESVPQVKLKWEF